MKKIVLAIIMILIVNLVGCTDVLKTDASFGAAPDTVTGASTKVEELKGNNDRPPRPEGEEDADRPPRPDGEEDGDRPPRPEDETEEERLLREEQRKLEGEGLQEKKDGAPKYSIDQAISDNAQLSTVAFSGLAFLTGTEGADAFFPPGKVADFFGFQYMRDVDVNGYGHNTTFLTKIASNILYILNDEQIALLKELATEQEALYEDFGYGRLNLIDAFRAQYEDGKTLDLKDVTDYSAYLYGIDGRLSYDRAEVFGKIVATLTDEQITYIEKMSFDDSSTWPEVSEDKVLDKKSMSHMSHVAVMTYASEFFSWYAGSTEADVYFCPERHGTYFGGFYMKDYPAMKDPNYFISTSITGDSGKEFIEILDETQKELMLSIIDEQKDELSRIVEIREEVVSILREFITDDTSTTSKEEKVMELMKEYGEIEGAMSHRYADVFSKIGNTLTETQKSKMHTLRNQYVFPEGSYLYSAPIKMPTTMSLEKVIAK